MCVELCLALFAGIRAHGVALTAFGADSGIELLSAFVLPAYVAAAPVLPLVAIAFLYPLMIELPTSGGHPWQLPNQHSPPGLLIASITVLRI